MRGKKTGGRTKQVVNPVVVAAVVPGRTRALLEDEASVKGIALGALIRRILIGHCRKLLEASDGMGPPPKKSKR